MPIGSTLLGSETVRTVFDADDRLVDQPRPVFTNEPDRPLVRVAGGAEAASIELGGAQGQAWPVARDVSAQQDHAAVLVELPAVFGADPAVLGQRQLLLDAGAEGPMRAFEVTRLEGLEEPLECRLR